MKNKRIENRDLLDYIKTLPCMACGQMPTDPAHVTSVGAGGDDVAVNVMPLCRQHHTEQHSKGWSHMVKNYIGVNRWLTKAKREDILNRGNK